MKGLVAAIGVVVWAIPASAQTVFPLGAGPNTEIAIAAGSRAGLLAVATSGAPLARVLVSTNDGADWREAGPSGFLTSSPADTLSTGRVALAFDPAGTLHLAAELYRRTPDTPTRVDLYYASSSNNGATWTPPVMLDATGNGGYPKLTIFGDRLFVTWGYRGDLRLHVAWSSDGGRSWNEPRDLPFGCINTSDVVVMDGAAFVACAGYPADDQSDLARGRVPFTGLRLYRIDSNALTQVSAIGTLKGVWPRLVARDGMLAIVADVYRIHTGAGRGWDKCCAAFTRSRDGGRTWSAPADLRGPLTADAEWDTFFIRTAGVDPRGRLHVVVNGSDQAAPANGAPGTDARLVHAILDPASGRVLHEASLTPPVAGPQGYYPGSVSLAFTSRAAIIGWISGTDLHLMRFDH